MDLTFDLLPGGDVAPGVPHLGLLTELAGHVGIVLEVGGKYPGAALQEERRRRSRDAAQAAEYQADLRGGGYVRNAAVIACIPKLKTMNVGL